jgi:hypothetical protein
MFDVEPELPKINIGGSNLSKSVDQTYKLAESSLGVTDLKDSLREGEPAAKVPVNTVTRVAAQMGHSFWGGSSASLGNTTDMIAASRGAAKPSATALAAIQSNHRF